MPTMVKPSGSRNWNLLAVLTTCGVALVVVLSIVVIVQNNHNAAKQSTLAASVVQERVDSDRRDCVTTLSTARRSVFDNLDIYKAIQIEQLSTALLESRLGIAPSAEQVKAFADNDAVLRTALVEARRLQPSRTLDELIAHGGTVDGIHYKACPN